MQYVMILLTLFVLLTGCKSNDIKPPETPIPHINTLVNKNLFSLVPVPSEQDIFTLPLEEQTKFLNKYNALIEQGIRPDKALYLYLEDTVSNFSYKGGTFSAPEVLLQESGNCISLAVLTQSYAQLAGLKTTFREVSTFPIFKREDNIVLISSHFSTKLLAPKNEEPEWITAIAAGTVVDYFPEQSTFYIGNAKYPSLVAKYYANLAAQALLKKNYDLSYSLTKAAFNFTPHNPELINLMAIIHRRAGDLETAKSIFEFALSHNLANNNLVSSYLFLAQQTKNHALVKRLEPLLDTTAKTPFDFIQVAQRALKNKQLYKSRKILKLLIENYSYLPEPYFEMARLYYLDEEHEKAKHFLEQAIRIADSKEKKARYQAKISSLQASLSKEKLSPTSSE